jgi:hypothetical protein
VSTARSEPATTVGRPATSAAYSIGISR